MPKLRIQEPEKRIKSFSFPLEQKSIEFGRKRTCEVILSHPSVSIIHAELEKVTGGFILKDLESTNGCKLDGEHYNKIDILEDISFELGDVEIDILFNDEELQTLEDEGDFISQEDSKNSSRKKKKNKKKEKVSPPVNHEELEEELDEPIDDYDEEEEEEVYSDRTFLITVIAFLITIGIALGVLFLTGNL